MFGWWSFSHEPEVYVPALALICFQLPWLLSAKQPGWGALCGLVILCAATIGFHQKHVLWYFVALKMLVMNLGSWKDSRLIASPRAVCDIALLDCLHFALGSGAVAMIAICVGGLAVLYRVLRKAALFAAHLSNRCKVQLIRTETINIPYRQTGS